MKNLQIAFFCTIFLSSFAQNRYDRNHFEAYPDFIEAITVFYQSDEDFFNLYFEFEKRYEGIYAVELNRNTYEESRRILIWDSVKKKYALNKNDELYHRANERAKYYRYWDAYINPLFGYKTYFDDVINLYEGIELDKMSPDELESLARAYSTSARKEFENLNPNSYYTKYDSTFNKNSISPSNVEKYNKKSLKSIDIYNNIIKYHPEHQTYVGSVRTKRSNDVIDYWLNSMIHQQQKEAENFLTMADYDSTIINFAKNYLNSCPLNSILFTYGDNDTYPLIYIQQKEGFRKDITIINISLLALGKYIYYISELSPEKEKLKLSLNTNSYKLNNNNIIIVKDILEDYDLSALFNESNKNNFLKNPYLEIKSSNFLINSGSNKIKFSYDEHYIYKENLIMLDIISSNWSERPICFTLFCTVNKMVKSMNNNLYVKGIVYELKQESHEENEPKIIFSETINLLKEKLKTTEHNSSYIDKSEYNLIHNAYYYFFKYAKKNNLLDNSEIKNLIELNFSDPKLCIGDLNLFNLSIYKDLNEEEKFLESIQRYIDELKYKFEYIQKNKNKALLKYNKSNEEWEQELNSFYDFLSEYGENYSKILKSSFPSFFK
jgi:hypothetical protein